MRLVEIGSSAEVGSSSSSTSGLSATARAMHSRCCWPPDRPSAFCFSLSLTSSHSAAWRRASSTRTSISAFDRRLVVADAVGDVLEDRHRERHRLLEHHADLAAQPVHRVLRVEHVLAVEQHFAARFLLRVQRVDAVEHAQQGRLAAAGRPDQRGHALFRDLQVDVLHRDGTCRSRNRGRARPASPARRGTGWCRAMAWRR